MMPYVVCRTNPASSVVIALARSATWMDDAQVQSVFHRLRHDPPPGLRHGPAAGWDPHTMVAQVFERANARDRCEPDAAPSAPRGAAEPAHPVPKARQACFRMIRCRPWFGVRRAYTKLRQRPSVD